MNTHQKGNVIMIRLMLAIFCAVAMLSSGCVYKSRNVKRINEATQYTSAESDTYYSANVSDVVTAFKSMPSKEEITKIVTKKLDAELPELEGRIKDLEGRVKTLEDNRVPPPKEYETRFHHTTTASSDGGKSLVLCLGQKMDFDKCATGNTEIPFHGYDKERVSYWNMNKAPEGDIVCTKDGEEYRYQADGKIVYGSCD